MSPIFLTGFMATGKSRIGRALAARLGRPFYDTDEMVEAGAGRAIPQIFAADGEEVFRRLEAECVRQAASRADAVVALGGGAIARPENRDAIRHVGGLLVCVEADAETILERVWRRDDRPLLAGLTRAQKRDRIKALLAERAPEYARADITVRTSQTSTVEGVVNDLLARLRQVPGTVVPDSAELKARDGLP